MPDLQGPSADVADRRTDFLNAAGTMSVDLVTYGAVQMPAAPTSKHQLISVLDGALTLHDGEEAHSFSAGETAYLHQGDSAAWTTSEGTRLLIASYTSP